MGLRWHDGPCWLHSHIGDEDGRLTREHERLKHRALNLFAGPSQVPVSPCLRRACLHLCVMGQRVYTAHERRLCALDLGAGRSCSDGPDGNAAARLGLG